MNKKTDPVEVVVTAEDAVGLFGPGSELARMMQATLAPAEDWRERLARQEREQFEKAKKIPAKDYEGHVSWPDHGPNEGYFESVDELLAWCTAEGETPPSFVWACTPEPLYLSVNWILDQALEEHYDGARSTIPAAEEERLQAFLDEWCKTQDVVSWHEDRSRVILLGGVR